MVVTPGRLLLAALVFGMVGSAWAADMPVSFHKDVRPILQANCFGCHQPAKAQGDFVMTLRDRLLAGGDSGETAVVPKEPAKSELIARVKGLNDKAVMPPGEGKQLKPAEIAVLEKWITEGAVDDTPANAVAKFDPEHPPVYTRAPVVPSLDVSPDGRWIAVAGFHEVLLHRADGSGIEARLIGLSERVESLRFSPDGQRLAVAGGLPGRMGELQIWDVAKKKLKLSIPVTADTIYGVSWSPDGKLIAFGCGDGYAVRAVEAETGKQVLYQGAHTDWVLGTVFSVDGKRLVSVSRDRSCKLTEVETQRFIDNITSITPGALRGGVLAVARHPQRDEVVVAGSDGQPKVYRLDRQTARVIGDDSNLIRELPALAGRAWTVAVSADGKRIVAGSSLDNQGEVGVYGYEFDTRLPDRIKAINAKVVTSRSAAENEELAKYHKEGVVQVAKAKVPAGVYAVAFLPDGKHFAAAGSDGMLRVFETETAKPVKEWAVTPAITTATAQAGELHPDFIQDVAPVLSRVGCNAGTCHGSKEGKNGFKLSLRGYDPIYDVRAFTDDHASRRVSVASPDNSLMLLKATGAVPHVGSQVVKPDSEYYRIIRAWIADGAKLDLTVPRVTKIDITPTNPIVEKPGGNQQFKVVATFADGKTRDVTREAFLESGNLEVVKADKNGVTTTIRRGEAPIMARYEGAYAATTLTVMGERAGFAWADPPKFNKIDEFTAEKWKRLKIQPSELCTDAEFLRRAYLDLTGLPPTADVVRAFLADARPTQVKRDAVIDQLVGSPEYIEYWTNKWADLLQVNRKFLGAEGAAKFRSWIRQELADNVPYDRFANAILTAQGSNKTNPQASYYKVLRQPAETMENTTHLFLAVRFNCNKCHDHPFERWTQDQYYETAAFFAQFGLKRDPSSMANIGGTEVEKAKPLFEEVYDTNQGDVTHDRTGAVTPPKFPYPAEHHCKPNASRREQLAAWMTSPDNMYFAKSYVNRIWGYMFGVGIIEPIDDIRAGNPATNPELLDYLTHEFVQSGFNVRHVHRLIAKSRTYQLSVATNKWNEDDKTNYAHSLARRLPAEVIYDAVHRVTGSTSHIPGLLPGTRAAELPDSGIELPGGFLNTLGRPPRESACECERVQSLQLGPVMALISGQVLNDAISDPDNALTKLVAAEADDTKLINELFLRVLNRPATEKEIEETKKLAALIDQDHARLGAALAAKEKEWAPKFVALQEERDRLINVARQELEEYRVKEYEPRQKQLKEQKAADLAKAEQALQVYDADIVKNMAAWEKQQQRQPEWVVLKPRSIKANVKDGKFKVEADGSIFVEAGTNATAYTFTSITGLTGITGIRVEALSDDRLPGKGPGRAENGNFVLTELDVTAAPLGDPKALKVVKFKNGLADFSQEGFGPNEAINGRNNARGDGWAIVPRTGEDHWMTAETAEPFGFDGGTLLTFKLSQNYPDKKHSIGRFRISVTTQKAPGLSLPDHVITALRRAPEERTADQKSVLVSYHARTDANRVKLLAAIAEAKKPVPLDATYERLKADLAQAERPVAIDPKLVQLRNDMKLSTEQLKNKRLIVAQDVTWALVNSPAFLFNR